MAEEYAAQCSRQVCLQLAAMSGFEVVSSSSLSVLSDVMETYIEELCTLARTYCEGAGRTEVNAEDLVLGLGEMGTPLDHVKDFRDRLTEECPFVKNIPEFPVAPARPKKPSFREAKEKPPAHVPDFLPCFPPKHTYVYTPVYPSQSDGLRERAIRAHDAKKAAEDVLVRLGQGAAATSNPFVASLLDAGHGTDVGHSGEGGPLSVSNSSQDAAAKSDDWTSLLLDKGEKMSSSTSIPLPFQINLLGRLGAAVGVGKEERSKDAFKSKDKGKKRPRASTTEPSIFKFKVRDAGGEGDGSDSGTEDLGEKVGANPSTHLEHTGTQAHDEPAREIGIATGATRRTIGNKRQKHGDAPEHMKGDGAYEPHAGKFDPISMDQKTHSLVSGSEGDEDVLEEGKDAVKAHDVDMSLLLDDEGESYQSDRSEPGGGDDDDQAEGGLGGYAIPQGSQEYRYGMELYGDTLIDHSQVAAIGDEDEEKEPLISGLFMNLDDGDMPKDGKDTKK